MNTGSNPSFQSCTIACLSWRNLSTCHRSIPMRWRTWLQILGYLRGRMCPLLSVAPLIWAWQRPQGSMLILITVRTIRAVWCLRRKISHRFHWVPSRNNVVPLCNPWKATLKVWKNMEVVSQTADRRVLVMDPLKVGLGIQCTMKWWVVPHLIYQSKAKDLLTTKRYHLCEREVMILNLIVILIYNLGLEEEVWLL